MFLELVLRQNGARWAHLVADVALVTSAGFVRRVLDPCVGLQFGPGPTDFPAVRAGHADAGQRLGLKLRRRVGQLLVGLKLRLGGEIGPLAEIAVLRGGVGIIGTFVVVALVEGIVVAGRRRTAPLLGLGLKRKALVNG